MRLGVLLAAYGSPRGLGDVERYLAHIRGRQPRPEEVEGLKARYAALGGRTPLLEVTERQAALLERELGAGWRVEVGYRHTPPFIGDAARALVELGVEAGVALPLAAHDSRLSVGAYHAAAREALAGLQAAPPFGYVHGFATHPLLLEAWAERVRAGLARLAGEARARATVLFTAHSLPAHVQDWGDPYPAQVRATCEGVARLAGLAAWEQCYQSAVGQDWLGPDVPEALEGIAKRGLRGVVVAPVGFVSDHLETLHDLDLEARARAEALGLAFVRCPALNDDPRFIALLADVARRALPA